MRQSSEIPIALFPLALTHNAVIEEKEWTSNVPTAAERERGWWCERGVTVATHNHHHHHQHHRHHHQHQREKSTSRARYSTPPTIPLAHPPVQPDTFATSLLQSFLFSQPKVGGVALSSICICVCICIWIFIFFKFTDWSVPPCCSFSIELLEALVAHRGIVDHLSELHLEACTEPMRNDLEQWLGSVVKQCNK